MALSSVHLLFGVLLISCMIGPALSLDVCQSSTSKTVCSWQDKKAIVFEGCVTVDMFRSSFQEEPFHEVITPLADNASPELCLLRCLNLHDEGMAAILDQTCWCSDKTSVRDFAKPEYLKATCRPCPMNFTSFHCPDRVGFFSLNDTLEGSKHSFTGTREPPVILHNGRLVLAKENVTVGSNIQLSCQPPHPPAMESDSILQWYFNGSLLNTTTIFSHCVAESNSSQISMSKFANGNSVLTVKGFSKCFAGQFTCKVSSSLICTDQFGCSRTSVWLSAIEGPVPDHDEDQIHVAHQGGGMKTWVKAAVAVGVILGVVLIGAGATIAHRSTRKSSWWYSTSEGASYGTGTESPQDNAADPEAGEQAKRKPFVTSNTLERVRSSFRPTKKADKVSKSQPDSKTQPMLPKSRSRRGFGILRAPPKPPRQGRPQEAAPLPPGYCAVGMTPSTSMDAVGKADKSYENYTPPDADGNQNAYAVSTVRTKDTAPAQSDNGYCAITAHPLEDQAKQKPLEGCPSVQSQVSETSQAAGAQKKSATQRLNYVDLDLVAPPSTSARDGEGPLQGREKTTYANLIPEAHLKGVRRGSDGSHL